MSTSLTTALFALGNFWQPAYEFAQLDGVLHVCAGYTGGTSNNPTYHDRGDHTEAVQVDYDAHAITYEDLLDVFWRLHDPDQHDRAAIFYFDHAQHHLAQASKQHRELITDHSVEITPAGKFYLAEGYHQHYIAKLRGEL